MVLNGRIWCGTVLLLLADIVFGLSLHDLPEARLQRKLIGEPIIRPVRNYSDTLDVLVELHPLCLKELNVAKQELSLVAGLGLSWENKFLAWNPQEYGGIQETFIPSSATWKPIFQISNSVTDAPDNEDASQSQQVQVASNGKMMWMMSRKFQTYCNVDVFYFPFDTQRCCITLSNWLSLGSYTHFIADDLATAIFINSTEWNLLETESFTDQIVVDEDERASISQVHFCLKLQRKSSYYVITIIMPLFLLSFVGLMVFPLPPASGEKVSLCVACLMSFSITQVAISAHLPTSWHSIPIIMILNICFMILNVLSVCVTVLNLHIHLREESDNKTGLSLMDLPPFNWKCKMFGKGMTSTNSVEPQVGQDGQVEMVERDNKMENHVEIKWKDRASLLNTCLSYVFVGIFLLLLIVFSILWHSPNSRHPQGVGRLD